MAKVTGHKTLRGAITIAAEQLDEIVVMPNQARYGCDKGLFVPGRVEALMVQIARDGQLKLVDVRVKSDSKVWLHEGRHRLEAIKRINANLEDYPELTKPLPLKAYKYEPMSDREAELASLSGNTLHPPGAMDMCQYCCALKKNYNMSDKEIAESIPYVQRPPTPSRVSQWRALAKLPEAVKDAIFVGEGGFTEAVGHMLLGIGCDDERMVELTEKFISGELKSKDIKALADKSKRRGGTSVRRTVSEFVELCNSVGSTRSGIAKEWILGTPFSDEDELRAVLSDDLEEGTEIEVELVGGLDEGGSDVDLSDLEGPSDAELESIQQSDGDIEYG